MHFFLLPCLGKPLLCASPPDAEPEEKKKGPPSGASGDVGNNTPFPFCPRIRCTNTANPESPQSTVHSQSTHALCRRGALRGARERPRGEGTDEPPTTQHNNKSQNLKHVTVQAPSHQPPTPNMQPTPRGKKFTREKNLAGGRVGE